MVATVFLAGSWRDIFHAWMDANVASAKQRFCKHVERGRGERGLGDGGGGEDEDEAKNKKGNRHHHGN